MGHDVFPKDKIYTVDGGWSKAYHPKWRRNTFFVTLLGLGISALVAMYADKYTVFFFFFFFLQNF